MNQTLKTRATQLWGIVALVMGAVLCAYGIFQLLRPAQYAATVKIKVESEQSMLDDGSTGAYYDPYFFPTTFEVIQSQLVLSNVVTTLNLEENWGRKYFGGKMLKFDETAKIIRDHIRFAQIQNTKFITITFYSEDPNEAAQVANAVAQAYQDYRVQEIKRTAATTLMVLQQQFQKEESHLAEIQTNLYLLKGQLKIVDNEPTNQTLEQLPYWNKKRELGDLTETHKLLSLKITAETIDMQVPTFVVQIMDPAEPPASPVSPNRTIAVLMIMAGVFLIIAGRWWLKPSGQADTST